MCEEKQSRANNRFAHSIEELVIWSIERRYGEYIDHELHVYFNILTVVGIH